MLLGAIGIFGHRGWGRLLGFLFGLLGTLAGIGAVVGANKGAFTTNGGTTVNLSQNMGPSVGFLVIFGFILLAMIVGGKHFRERLVE